MLEEKMRIGGKKVEGENGNLDVLNPFNGEKVGSVPRASENQVDHAMEIAKNFQPELTRYERQQIIETTAKLPCFYQVPQNVCITCSSGFGGSMNSFCPSSSS